MMTKLEQLSLDATIAPEIKALPGFAVEVGKEIRNIKAARALGWFILVVVAITAAFGDPLPLWGKILATAVLVLETAIIIGTNLNLKKNQDLINWYNSL